MKACECKSKFIINMFSLSTLYIIKNKKLKLFLTENYSLTINFQLSHALCMS